MALKACTHAIVVGVLLAACATEPHVMVLPGSGKTLDQFHADDVACREWATRQQAGPTSYSPYDMAYVQCMYAKGNQIPTVGGPYPAYTPPASAAPPANVPSPPEGTPPPPPPGPVR
jgi:hypothetical protein